MFAVQLNFLCKTGKIRDIFLYNMEEIIFLVEPAEEAGYTAKALTHSIFTQTDTLVAFKENIKDAVHCHFDDMFKRIGRLHLVHQEGFAA